MLKNFAYVMLTIGSLIWIYIGYVNYFLYINDVSVADLDQYVAQQLLLVTAACTTFIPAIIIVSRRNCDH